MELIYAQEFAKRYLNTFAFSDNTNKPLSVYFSDFRVNPEEQTAFYKTSSNSKNFEVALDIIVPTIKPIEHAKLVCNAGELLFYYRKPHRQYRKGYCLDNTDFLPLLPVYLSSSDRTNRYAHTYRNESRPNFDNVYALYTTDYTYSLEDAVKACDLGIAISEEWGLTISCEKGVDFILWRHNQMVAKIKGYDIVTYAFTQEVQDLVKRFSTTKYEVIDENKRNV